MKGAGFTFFHNCNYHVQFEKKKLIFCEDSLCLFKDGEPLVGKIVAASLQAVLESLERKCKWFILRNASKLQEFFILLFNEVCLFDPITTYQLTLFGFPVGFFALAILERLFLISWGIMF